MLQRKSSAGTTGATSGTGSENPSGAPAFSPSFSVIRVVQSSVSCSVCCRSLSCFLDLRFLSDYLFGIFKLSLTFVLEINNEGRLKTKFYDKRDDFTFPLINLPFFSSTIPAALSDGDYTSQLICYSRACDQYSDFLHRAILVMVTLLK